MEAAKSSWKSPPISTRKPRGWQTRSDDGARRAFGIGTKRCCADPTPISHVLRCGSESLGIPVLYLSDLFERAEIRDLLALISFTCEPKRGGLLRVAAFLNTASRCRCAGRARICSG